ncbi:LuxR family transcriptional regulator, maltose regulon positive regulatory protein [Terribacillus halophilus]|uniref:LuxR family transcriptional regulator, maltose regulon positive regulatory protein n=2 Tax=Terribacillus halophilus TaxID=361279 RepID=A0A1G6IP74_9BACI|nr:LuxR family transcriptional regulator, maltose regulon positive regulatory protein [Terribacillus halophilus]
MVMREQDSLNETAISAVTVGQMRIKRIKQGSVWTKIETCKLTTVTAPSGYGKTTMLQEWAAQTHLDVGWVSLEEEDIQRVAFWKKIILHMPGLPEQDRKHLLDIIQSASYSPTHFIATWCACLREHQVTGALVIDDFHLMINSNELYEMTTLLEEMPNTFHIIVSGHVFPGLSFKRLLRQHQVLQITKRDLIFTEEEIESYIRNHLHKEPTDTAIQNIMQQTQGWAAGLQLIHMYEQFQEDYSELQFSNVLVARQLIQEIVYSLHENERNYLLSTSILNEMHVRLCDYIAGTRRGRVVMRRLREQGLLIEHQEEPGWFTYNKHLRTYLKEMLEMQNMDVNELYNRASVWHENEQMLLTAIRYAWKAGDYPRVNQLLIKAAPCLLQEGRIDQLQEWINRLPRKYIYQMELGIIYGWVECLRYQPDLAQRHAHMIEEQLLRRELQFSEEEEKRHFADLYTLKSFISLLEDDVKSTMDYASKALVYSKNSSRYFSHSFDYNRHDATILHSPLGGGGDLRSVQRVYEGLAHTVTNESVFSGYYHLSLAELAYEWGMAAKAKSHLEKALAVADLFGLPGLLVPAYILKARHELEQQGDAQSAKATLHGLKDMLTRSNASADWFKKAEAARIRIAIYQGDTKRIHNWLSLFHMQEPPIEQKTLFEYITLVWAYSAIGEVETTQKYIKKLMPLVKFGNRINAEIELHIIQATLLYATDKQQAILSLKDGLRLSTEHKYLRIYWRGGESMRDLLQELLSMDAVAKKQRKYIEQILSYWSEETDDQKLQNRLTSRELQLVYHLQLGKRNNEIAQELDLSLGTVKVYFHRIYEKLGVKNRKQAKELAAGLDFSDIL